MNQDTEPDPDDVPRAVDPRSKRRPTAHPLPGPRRDSGPAALGPPSPTIAADERIPAAEVSVTPDHVYVTVELPGAPKDALDIEATDRRLRVRAPRVGAPTFHLDLELPSPVDPRSAKATYRNGILDVTLSRIPLVGGEADEA
jgi:HSP20 family molecular chaperone IbpA